MIASKSKNQKTKLCKIILNSYLCPTSVSYVILHFKTQNGWRAQSIERLGKAKEQGLITEEEFQEQKKKCFA
jgi:hypothetical protein